MRRGDDDSADDDQNNITVTAENGAVYELQEVSSDEHLLGIDNDVIAFTSRRFPHDSVFVRRKTQIFHVKPTQQHGMLRGHANPAYFARSGYERLTAIPSNVYTIGVAPDPDIGVHSPGLNIRGSGWVGVPAECWVENSDLVEVVTCHGKRFARQTPKGLEIERGAEETARAAEYTRQAAETARRDMERKERERAANAARLVEEARKQTEWLARLPRPFLPGAKVLDMREATPRIGEVRYEGVSKNIDGTYKFSDKASARPPECFKIIYNIMPDHSNVDTRSAWENSGHWDQWKIYLHQVPEDFIEYRGPERSAGSRIPRSDALRGRADPCPPAHGDLEFVRIEVIGREYNGRFGDNLTVEDAIEILKQQMPVRTNIVRYERGPEPDEDQAEDDETGSWEQEVDLPRDYEQLFSHGGNIWSARRFEDFPLWRREHLRLLKKEDERRKKGSDQWQRRKLLFTRLIQLLNARHAQFCGDDFPEFDSGGIAFELAIEGSNLDFLVEKLRSSDCEVLVLNVMEKDSGILSSDHAAPPIEQMERIWAAWQDCRGDADIFHSYTIDLCHGQRGSFVTAGILQRKSTCLFVGPTKIGKSTILYEWGFRVASGLAFAGLPVQQGKVVFGYGEDTSDTIGERRRLLSGALGNPGKNLVEFNIKNYAGEPSEFLKRIRSTLGKIDLLIIDPISLFVSNTSAGGAMRETMNMLNSFSEEMDGAVIAAHHTLKAKTAANATSAVVVFDSTMGSGESIFAARQILTVHGKADGTRHVTLVADNFVAGTPKLQNPLVLKLNMATGLHENLEEPLISAGPIGSTPHVQQNKKSGIAGAHETSGNLDANAHVMAAVIRRIESDGNGKVPINGPKAPFKLKLSNELPGLTRTECVAAHKRAIEFGLLTDQ